MASSYRIVPPALSTPSSSQTRESQAQTTDLGVHDALRFGLRTVRSEILPAHPLENRLKHWTETQDKLKLQMARDVYGIHAPIRIQMERHLVSQGKAFNPFVASSNLSRDILNGSDDTIEFEDFLGDSDLAPDNVDVHVQMERGLLQFK
ncbi:proteasome maturation factor UMP1-domain-containing protein [Hyaloraphidium curvatum]|nr:proteasome maturation factor UMP1-domain-containing protein [Hyaloraphidium curvatum]